MRKDKNWGYWRYDMRFDPVFPLKVSTRSCLLFHINANFTNVFVL